MFKIINKIKNADYEINKKRKENNLKIEEFEKKWDYIGKKNASIGKKLP